MLLEVAVMVLVVFTVEGVVISRTCKVEMMLSGLSRRGWEGYF